MAYTVATSKTRTRKIRRIPWDQPTVNLVLKRLRARRKTGESMLTIARSLSPKRSEGALRQMLFARGYDAYGRLTEHAEAA
jgi:hypothetical protein